MVPLPSHLLFSLVDCRVSPPLLSAHSLGVCLTGPQQVAFWLVTVFRVVGVLLLGAHTHKGHCFLETTFSVGF